MKLHQVALLSPAQKNVIKKKYWVKKRGQVKLDRRSASMHRERSDFDVEKKLKDGLIREQKSIRADYKSARVKECELGTIVKNMDTILGKDDRSVTKKMHRDEVL